ncbi:MAG: GDYXXLXY domain-containing protein [Limisphaerales bacterium]
MKLKLLILILALQSAWLLGTAAVQEHALATGKVILLETARVDPRDLLRGDYLILNYKISDVPTKLFSPPVKKDLPDGTKVFVAVAPTTNQFYAVVKASTNEFVPAADEVLLKGRSAWPRWNAATNSIHIEYGLERFYVAEGTGNPTGKLTAQAVVPASGRGRVKEVFVDGKPYAEAMKDIAR